MQTRVLGRSELSVSEVGLGCMGMSEFYGPSDEAESLNTLHHALTQGMNFWDTADIYGNGRNEELVGKGLKARRDQVVLATKFGVMRDEQGEFIGINGRPEYIRQACEASLKRLGIDHIDLYYQHRVDPNTPIEETVGALSRLVEEGKVRYLGLSEASAETLNRACAVHQITALQSEYSLWSRDIEQEIIPACESLGVSLVAYSPLGRGFLSGQIKTLDDLSADDWRRSNPRFSEENFAKNLDLIDEVERIAQEKSCTPAQLALAWLLAQNQSLLPIPGTRRIKRVDENTGASNVVLSEQDLALIESVMPRDIAAGTRYPESMMGLLNA